MISAVFPLALAFAVDPGWSMVLWTVGLIARARDCSATTSSSPGCTAPAPGLSAMSLMVSATFWTALWGPVGLIMSTPLTVCLLVIGRHLPRLQFLDVLLGSQPALDTPTRIYQRLLADDVEEAIELATEQSVDGNVRRLLQRGRPAGAAHGHQRPCERRHRRAPPSRRDRHGRADRRPARAASGAALARGRPRVVCIGGKWEVDTLAARMLAHALDAAGAAGEYRPAATVSADYIARLDLDGRAGRVPVVLQPRAAGAGAPLLPPAAAALARREDRAGPVERAGRTARRRSRAPARRGRGGHFDRRGGRARGRRCSAPNWPRASCRRRVPEADAERLAALQASGALDPRAQPLFDAASQARRRHLRRADGHGVADRRGRRPSAAASAACRRPRRRTVRPAPSRCIRKT